MFVVSLIVHYLIRYLPINTHKSKPVCPAAKKKQHRTKALKNTLTFLFLNSKNARNGCGLNDDWALAGLQFK